jgi:Flp pilus assembly protein TadD/4-amino-4-deoxy-L-arabinose transferase-like glycosyltransferase
MSRKETKHARQGKKRDGASLKDRLWPVAAVFLVAVLVRGLYLYQSQDNPTFSAPIVDAMTYDQMAREFAGGSGLTSEFFWQPTFYPLFLSAVYWLSKSSILCVKLVQVLLGGLTCVLVYLLGNKVFGKPAGALAGLICAFCMPLVFFEGELLATGWAAFGAVAIILALLSAREKPTVARGFILGLTCALGIAARSVFLPFVVAACAWLLIAWILNAVGIRRFLSAIVGLAAGFFVVAGPQLLMSRKVIGKATITPYSGGINFYIGNNPDYKQTITTRPGIAWRKLTELPVEVGITDRLQTQQFFFDRTKDYIKSQPLSYLKGLGYKTAQFASSREMPRNVDIYLFRKWSGLLGIGVWKIDGFGFPFGLLLPLAIVGIVCRVKEVTVPIWLFMVLYPTAVILVFVAARYRVPIVPVMSVLAAAGCLAIYRLFDERRWKKLAVVTVAFVGTGMVSSIPGPFYAEQLDFEPELYYCLGDSLDKRDRTAQAVEAYSKAISLRPGYVEAHHNLGLLLVDEGKIEEAIGHYNTALKTDPENAGVHDDLGMALSKVGKIEEAIAHYEQAITINPKSYSAHDNLGTAFYKLGRMPEAVEHYSKAIELKPDDPVPHNNLGNIFAIQGQPEKAIEHYEISLNLKPDDPETLSNMANALSALKRFSEATEKYLRALKIKPDDAGIYCNLGICLKQQGRIDEAIEAFNKALAIDPQNKRASEALGGMQK